MKSDVILVGSGVGGATVARELSIRGYKVIIIEKGKYHKLGTARLLELSSLKDVTLKIN